MSKELSFKIWVKDNFDRALSMGARHLQRFQRVAGGVAKGIKATFKGLLDWRTIAAGGGLLGGIGVSIKKAFDVETVQTQLKVALGNAKEAKKIYKEMVNFSDATNFEADEVTKLGTSLIATGSAAADVIDEIKMLGDIAAGTSTPLSELGNILIKIRGKGKLQGDTMDMFMERGIPIVKALAQELGVAESEISDLVSSGQVGFPLVVKALKSMTGEGGQFHKMMEELSTTGNGLISTLKGKWSSALAEFGAHFSELSKGAIQGLIDRIDKLRNDGTIEKWANRGAKAAKVLANVMGDIFSGDQAERARALGQMGTVIQAMFKDAGTAFMSVVGPKLLEIFSHIPGYKSLEDTKEGWSAMTGKVASVQTAGEIMNDRYGMLWKFGKGRKERIAEYENLRDNLFANSGNDNKSAEVYTLPSLLSGMFENITTGEKTNEQYLQDQFAKKAGKKLAVWMRDPSLMLKEGAEAAGLGGFFANGKVNSEIAEGGKSLGGKQVSLSEIFTRHQDGSKEDKLGTRAHPMVVTVQELESTEVS